MKARHLEGRQARGDNVPAECKDTHDKEARQLPHRARGPGSRRRAHDALPRGARCARGRLRRTSRATGHGRARVRPKSLLAPACAGRASSTQHMDAIVGWFPAMADFGRIPLVNGEQLTSHRTTAARVPLPAFREPQRPAERTSPSSRCGWHPLTRRASGSPTRTRAQEPAHRAPPYLSHAVVRPKVPSAAAGDIVVVPKLRAMTKRHAFRHQQQGRGCGSASQLSLPYHQSRAR